MLRKVLIEKVPNTVGGAQDKRKKEKTEEKTREDRLSHFASIARWTVLSHEETAIEEPLNPSFRNARVPDISEEDDIMSQ